MWVASRNRDQPIPLHSVESWACNVHKGIVKLVVQRHSTIRKSDWARRVITYNIKQDAQPWTLLNRLRHYTTPCLLRRAELGRPWRSVKHCSWVGCHNGAAVFQLFPVFHFWNGTLGGLSCACFRVNIIFTFWHGQSSGFSSEQLEIAYHFRVIVIFPRCLKVSFPKPRYLWIPNFTFWLDSKIS